MSTRGPGRPRETTHDQIRTVALDLFAAKGYSQTSLAEIARAAGISRTTLFSYFPAKRDLLWEDFDRRRAEVDAALADGTPDRPVVDLIVEAMLVNADYSAAERTLLAWRKRIAEQDDEMRAYTALAVADLTAQVLRAARRLVAPSQHELLELVTAALVAAAAHCTDEWVAAADPATDPAADPAPDPATGLRDFTAERLAPIIAALRPLLPASD